MRIAIDAMGGDNAPGQIIAGALQSTQLLDADDELILLGPADTIRTHLTEVAANLDRSLLGNGSKTPEQMIRIVDAPEIIHMDEVPIDALRKKRKSSISIMAKMAALGQVDAVISAGNTGACVAACQMRMRNLPGINRPGIAVVLPTFEGPVVMCDVGANIACKPINLYQYAFMASLYARHILGIENPRVGLMSVGEEDAKGNEIVKKTRSLLKSDSNINFCGNIEGRDIFNGACDVAVCEGFVGNVVLKLTEGLVSGLFKAIGHELGHENRRLADTFEQVMKSIFSKYDYNEYGGAPLLGINGNAVICHGSSQDRTIKNAVSAAKLYHTKKINEQIAHYITAVSVRNPDE